MWQGAVASPAVKSVGLRAIVTGAGAGIGRTIAQAFVAQGGRAHIADIDGSTLGDLGEGLTGTVADVSHPDDVDRMFDEAVDALGRLDVLVNNAGIAGPTAAVESIDPAEWRRTLEVNLDGYYLCCRRAMPIMKAAGAGGIVNMASTAGQMGYPRRAPYAASKWAVIGLTKTLAMEAGDHGIRVNAIAPGSVDGARMDRVIEAEAEALDRSPDEVRAAYEAQASLRSFVTADDVAAAVIFLCSPAAAKITGQVIAVDGHTETLRT